MATQRGQPGHRLSSYDQGQADHLFGAVAPPEVDGLGRRTRGDGVAERVVERLGEVEPAALEVEDSLEEPGDAAVRHGVLLLCWTLQGRGPRTRRLVRWPLRTP